MKPSIIDSEDAAVQKQDGYLDGNDGESIENTQCDCKLNQLSKPEFLIEDEGGIVDVRLCW